MFKQSSTRPTSSSTRGPPQTPLQRRGACGRGACIGPPQPMADGHAATGDYALRIPRARFPLWQMPHRESLTASTAQYPPRCLNAAGAGRGVEMRAVAGGAAGYTGPPGPGGERTSGGPGGEQRTGPGSGGERTSEGPGGGRLDTPTRRHIGRRLSVSPPEGSGESLSSVTMALDPYARHLQRNL